MKKFLAAMRRFFSRESIKKTGNLVVNAEVTSLDVQIRAHDEVAEKNNQVIVSREITGLIVKSNFARKNNIEKVLHATAEKVGMDSSSPEFAKKMETVLDRNPDFFSSFFDSATNVSTEEIRKYWAAVLKGELKSPGKMSPLVVDVLKKIDRVTVILFEKVLEFQCDSWMFCDLEREFPISIREVNRLVERGLMLPRDFGQSVVIHIDKNGWGKFNHRKVQILIERIEGEGDPHIPSLNFTTAAILLSDVVVEKCLPHSAYLARIAKLLDTDKTERPVLGASNDSKFRLWLQGMSGDSILIDPAKSDGGVLFYFKDDGTLAAKRISPPSTNAT